MITTLRNSFSDTLNILAFKWGSIRPSKNKYWIIAILVFVIAVIMGAAFFGTAIRRLVSSPSLEAQGAKETVLLWINLFLQDNATIATSGIIWATLGAVILIPLIGYSFSSLIPEGDLVSVKRTDAHKIGDSVFLQFMSSISFIQIVVITSIIAILTISSERPGLAIVFGWSIWLTSILFTVMFAWFFEFLLRKYGLISKFLALGLIVSAIGLGWSFNRESMLDFFGLAEHFTVYLQNMSFDNLGGFFVGVSICVVLIIVALFGTVTIATKTLQLPERKKKKKTSTVFWARIGIAQKERKHSLTSFMLRLILRQNNTWKPLALAAGFVCIMSFVLMSYQQAYLTLGALIPVLVSITWAVNAFGIIGPGVTWMVSNPKVRKNLLGSIMNVQYLVIAFFGFITLAVTIPLYNPPGHAILTFVLSLVASTSFATLYSVKNAMLHPYRYRVHIRGESVIPPNKAFSYTFKIFIIGFFATFMVTLGTFVAYSTALSSLIQIGITLAILAISYMGYRSIRNRWIYDNAVMQNIIKTVGSN